MNKILISYRREDSADITGRIYDRLIRQFERASVFKDVDSIPLGVDFRIYLDEQVSKCEVFLAVIGRDWGPCVFLTGTRMVPTPGPSVSASVLPRILSPNPLPFVL